MSNCKCDKVFETLTFQRCARGFILRSDGEYSNTIPTIYAFDHIQDVASWLADHFPDDAK